MSIVHGRVQNVQTSATNQTNHGPTTDQSAHCSASLGSSYTTPHYWKSSDYTALRDARALLARADYIARAPFLLTVTREHAERALMRDYARFLEQYRNTMPPHVAALLEPCRVKTLERSSGSASVRQRSAAHGH